MAKSTKSKPKKLPSRPAPKRSSTPRTPREDAPSGDILALFRRKEGCTTQQYAEATGLTRQAATKRLQRFADLGLLVATASETPVSLSDLAKGRLSTGRHPLVYRVRAAGS